MSRIRYPLTHCGVRIDLDHRTHDNRGKNAHRIMVAALVVAVAIIIIKEEVRGRGTFFFYQGLQD